MSMIFILTVEQWEDLVRRMHGEGVPAERLKPTLDGRRGIAMAGTVQDMILWLTHVAALIEDTAPVLPPALEHVRYLADQIRWDGSETWYLPNVSVKE